MSERQERLIAYLSRATSWVTAGELSDHLGVSTRSVRSYITAAKAAAHPLELVESSPSGYRLNREVYAVIAGTGRDEAQGPRDRLYSLARRLVDTPDGVDLHSLADSLFVSESTIEADLRKLRADFGDLGLALSRQDNLVRISGSEQDLRRLLSRMFQQDGAQGFLELESIELEFASTNLREFKTDLIAMLDSHGYFVNEYGINNVLLHVAIAVDRVTRHPNGDADTAGAASGAGEVGADALPEPAPRGDDIPGELARIAAEHFGVTLGALDLDYLSTQLTTRVINRGSADLALDPADSGAARQLDLVRRIVRRVADEYLVDLDDEEFVRRLALHVGNLVSRARDRSSSRNPMSRSLKTAYPMIYELAVFIASELQLEESIIINDDEISYIALHVGSYLERAAQREERVTCALVCPGYYDMHLVLRERIEAELGADLRVDVVITRTDVDWSELTADIVVTTIAESLGVAFEDNVVVIRPFLGAADVDAIRSTIARVRRHARRRRLKDELLHVFDEDLFLQNFRTADETSMIAALGQRMVTAGIIDEAYLERAVERERMSSTAFTDYLAVPHALSMTASRTAICIVVNEEPMDWGENRVNVVALVAFSAADRATFEVIFGQFVSVFADRDEVRRIVRSTDFPSFIEELVRSIDR